MSNPVSNLESKGKWADDSHSPNASTVRAQRPRAALGVARLGIALIGVTLLAMLADQAPSFASDRGAEPRSVKGAALEAREDVAHDAVARDDVARDAVLQDAPADADPTLTWRKPEGAELLEGGKKLFAEGQYDEAGQQFKDARKLAKGRATQNHVNGWLLAAQGGARLAVLEKQVDSNPRGVFQQAEAFYGQYRETPIGPAYDKLLQGLREQLFLSLETFDRPSPRFSENRGKTFVAEPEFVKQGKHALRWETIDFPSALKIEDDLPNDLTKFKGVSFWINFPQGGMSYWVVFKGKGKSASGLAGTQLTNNTYSVQRKHKKGWHRVEIPFKDFTQFGAVSWDKIESFQIYFDQKRKVVLYVDDVCLVK